MRINKQPKDTPARAFIKGKKQEKIISENKQETKDRKSELNHERGYHCKAFTGFLRHTTKKIYQDRSG